jgi:hypothetical protein
VRSWNRRAGTHLCLHTGPVVQTHNRIHAIHVTNRERISITSGDHAFELHLLTAGDGARAGRVGRILGQDWGG